jgi:butyryl-CoA dehydrogenase
MYALPDIKTGFDLTEDQRMIRDMVREFADNEVKPLAHDIDEHHRFPTETWEKIVELGLPGIPFSEEVGGAEGGTLAYCLAVEELGRVCGSTGLTLAAHVSLGTYPIYAWGGEHLRSLYVPKLIAGEYMGAYGLTEPGAGSDSGATRTTARREGDEWVLNGRKCFITNANHAGVFIVTATVDRSLGSKGICAFVVPRETPGFSLEKGEVKLGMRGSDWASLVFEDARIPADHLLGPEGEGFKTFMKTLEGGRISIGALSLGIAQGAYEEAVRYATERLPVLVAPLDARNPVQPIAVRDVLEYLLLALERGPCGVVEVGAELLSFLDMMRAYAAARGLRRRALLLPTSAPAWLGASVGTAAPRHPLRGWHGSARVRAGAGGRCGARRGRPLVEGGMNMVRWAH